MPKFGSSRKAGKGISKGKVIGSIVLVALIASVIYGYAAYNQIDLLSGFWGGNTIAISPSSVPVGVQTTSTVKLNLPKIPVGTVFSIVLVTPNGVSQDVYDGQTRSNNFALSFVYTYDIAGTWVVYSNFGGGIRSISTRLVIGGTVTTTATLPSTTSIVTTSYIGGGGGGGPTSVPSSSIFSSTPSGSTAISVSPSYVPLSAQSSVQATLNIPTVPKGTAFSLVLVDPSGISYDVYDGQTPGTSFGVVWAYTYSTAGAWAVYSNFSGGYRGISTSLSVGAGTYTTTSTAFQSTTTVTTTTSIATTTTFHIASGGGQRNIGLWQQSNGARTLASSGQAYADGVFNGPAHFTSLEMTINENYPTDVPWLLSVASRADSAYPNAKIEVLMPLDPNGVFGTGTAMSFSQWEGYAQQFSTHSSVVSIGFNYERSDQPQLTSSIFSQAQSYIQGLGKQFINYYTTTATFIGPHSNYPNDQGGNPQGTNFAPVSELDAVLSGQVGMSNGYYAPYSDPFYNQGVIDAILLHGASAPAANRVFVNMAYFNCLDSTFQNWVASSQYRGYYA